MATITLMTGNLFVMYDVVAYERPEGSLVEVINQSLPLVGTVDVRKTPIHIEVNQLFNIQHAANNINKIITVGNVLVLNQSVFRGKYAIAANHLAFTQSTRTVQAWPKINQSLIITDSVSFTRGLMNRLVLEQNVTMVVNKIHNINQALSFQDAVNVYKANDPDFVLGE